MMNAIVLLATVAVSFALKAPTIVPNTLTRVVFGPLPKVYVYDHCPFCGKCCVLLLACSYIIATFVGANAATSVITKITSFDVCFENADVFFL